MGKFFHRAKVQPRIVAGEIAGVYHVGILDFQVESHVPLLLIQLPHKIQVCLDAFEIPCALVGSTWNAVECEGKHFLEASSVPGIPRASGLLIGNLFSTPELL